MRDFTEIFNQRPLLVTLAGPNGAGKSTFYKAFLEPQALQFVNADVIARELGIDAYAAARVADSLREEMVRQRESFVFETVFSDPVGSKISFLLDAARAGFTVVLIFIGVSGPETSERRVAQRISEGGHDVPAEKLISRFPRTMENLRKAIRELPLVLVFDNNDLNEPYRSVAHFESGGAVELAEDVPAWLREMLP